MRIIQGGYGQQSGAAISGTSQGSAARPARGGDGAADVRSPSGEHVTISARAQQLADQTAAADTEKVGRLRDAVQGGTFKIDPQAIANRIVNGD